MLAVLDEVHRSHPASGNEEVLYFYGRIAEHYVMIASLDTIGIVSTAEVVTEAKQKTLASILH